MSLFDNLIRYGMPFVPKPIVGKVAQRYVAGEEVSDAVRTIKELNDEGAMATVDVLGEEIHDPAKAKIAVDQYLGLLETIDAENLDSNVSIKPTMLGLKIDEEMCRDHIGTLVRRAAELDNFVRIDMEDNTCTDATIRIYRHLHSEHGHLLPLGPNIRLCKGIYREPRMIAWKQYETVRSNFIYTMEKLLAGGAYVGIATHDVHLVWAGMAAVDRLGLRPEEYEFQMLYGVDPELRRIILDRGHRLRVYVPFGKDWYPYSMRRLRENPTVAHHVTRAMLGLGPR
jgi:proline dehydrogenase